MARRDLEKLRLDLKQLRPVQVQQVDQGKAFDPREFDGLNTDELYALSRRRGWAMAEPGQAPIAGQLPNKQDLDSLNAAQLGTFYFTDWDSMTPSQRQQRYTQLLQTK